MQDLLDATVVDIEIDSTGKLWVNVNERCVLRIGHIEGFQFLHQPNALNRTIIMQRDGSTRITDNYSNPPRSGVIPRGIKKS